MSDETPEVPQPSSEESPEDIKRRFEEAGFLDHDPADPTVTDKEFMTQEQRDLLDDTARNVVGWNPDREPEIVGEVLDITESESEYGAYPLITIRTPGGRDIALHCFHTILKRDIQRRIDHDGLHVGDTLAVVYKGRGIAVGGKNAPALYNVRVRMNKK